MEITPRAAAKLQALVAGGGVVRLAIRPGGCAGLSYELAVEPEAWPGDELIAVEGIDVAVDQGSAPYLRTALLDHGEGPNGPAFSMANRSLVGVCGCAGPLPARHELAAPPAHELVWASEGGGG